MTESASPKTPTVTLLDVAEKVIELADADPAFIYARPGDGGSCRYVHRDDEGQPIPGEGCIVGRALTSLGATLEPRHEGYTALSLLSNTYETIPGYETDPHDSANLAMRRELNYVQTCQDTGWAWGRAITPALRRLVAEGRQAVAA